MAQRSAILTFDTFARLRFLVALGGKCEFAATAKQPSDSVGSGHSEDYEGREFCVVAWRLRVQCSHHNLPIFAVCLH